MNHPYPCDHILLPPDCTHSSPLSNDLFLLILRVIMVTLHPPLLALLGWLDEGHLPQPVLLVDHDLGEDEPHEPTELAFPFNSLGLVLAEDGLAEGVEVVVVQELRVLIVLDEVAGEVEEQGTTASSWGEELLLLKVQFLGVRVHLLVHLASAAAPEELVEVTTPQGEDAGDESVLSEGTHLILSD
jgi:hypothetical protein